MFNTYDIQDLINAIHGEPTEVTPIDLDLFTRECNRREYSLVEAGDYLENHFKS